MKWKRKRKGKKRLTTADREVKCKVEEGVACDDELWDGMAIN